MFVAREVVDLLCVPPFCFVLVAHVDSTARFIGECSTAVFAALAFFLGICEVNDLDFLLFFVGGLVFLVPASCGKDRSGEG